MRRLTLTLTAAAALSLTGCGDLAPGEVVHVQFLSQCPTQGCHTPGWHIQTRSNDTGEVGSLTVVSHEVAQACPVGSHYPECAM